MIEVRFESENPEMLISMKGRKFLIGVSREIMKRLDLHDTGIVWSLDCNGRLSMRTEQPKI